MKHSFGTLGLDEVVACTAAINTPSEKVMQRIGMTRDPALDFDHPKLPEGHRLRPHIVYSILNPDAHSGVFGRLFQQHPAVR